MCLTLPTKSDFLTEVGTMDAFSAPAAHPVSTTSPNIAWFAQKSPIEEQQI